MKKATPVIVLIVALVLVCAGIGAVAWYTFGTRIPFYALQAPFVSATADETKTASADGVSALKVEDEAGNVRITGADVEQVTIEVHKTGYGRTQDEAQKEVDGIQFEIVREGETLVVRYKLPNRGQIVNGSPNSVDFTITVPQDLPVAVEATFGKVELSGTRAGADLHSAFGDIEVENLEGALSADTQSGRVQASSITAGAGTILLKSGFGDVTLEKASAGKVQLDSESGALELGNVRATGDVSASTSFGDITLEGGAAGSLTIKTQSGRIQLTSVRVTGDLKAESNMGDIDLDKVSAGSYDVDTDSGSVTLNGARGPVKARTSFGDITVTQAQQATLDLNTQSGSIRFEGSLGDGPHTLHSDFGEVRLSLPTDSALDVDLQTDFGEIRSDLPITIVSNGNVDKSHQAGAINGGGAQLKVSTNSGGITIEALKE